MPKLGQKCLYCHAILLKGETKYCSNQCMQDFLFEHKKQTMIRDGYDTSYRQHIAKRYLCELDEGKCKLCKLNEWQGKPMPLVLDHIDGNSDNNYLSNLRVICNNCDALTDTYKAKNKGKGRIFRMQRYKEGKSY